MPVAATIRRPAASHAHASVNTARPPSEPRSSCQPSRSSRPRRKIGSAEAKSTAKMSASGRPMSRPRMSGSHQRAASPDAQPGARDRAGPGRGRHAWSTRHDGPERPRRHAGDGRGGPARDGQPRHRRHGGAEEGQRAERVQHRQERVAADGDEPREDQRRDRQPGVERIRSPSLTAHQPGREQRHRHEQHDVDAERGAVEDDFGEEPEAEGGREETSSDGSVQWAVLRCGRRGQARVGGQGSGRLGRTSCGDDRGQGRRTAPPCRTGRGTMAG